MGERRLRLRGAGAGAGPSRRRGGARRPTPAQTGWRPLAARPLAADRRPRTAVGTAVALALLSALAPEAQPVPEGPGLGAVRDTVTLQAGAAFVQLRPPVAPRSVRVDVLAPEPRTLSPEAYAVDEASGALRLVAPFDTLTVLAIAYRRLPGVAPPPPLPVYRPPPDSARGRPPEAPGGRGAPFATGVTTSGSITRGVVAGSNRDVSLTSGLRLEVGGEVAPGFTVEGALTDSDTPIVPEGTTQALSDFDRVFVRVEGPGASARLGDVDLDLGRASAFASLRRKVQGAALSLDLPAAGPLAGGRVEAAASAVRGRFRSQDLVLREGVQGPYRLEGDRGEAFVLVVPGSEQVFWDGRPLARGAGYTIDYGTGEVTFTAQRLVTAERRATVDFEYRAGGYARTLTAFAAEAFALPTARGPGARIGVRLLREADAPALGDALGLSEADLDRIAGAGDRDVLVPGETLVPLSPESPTVLYARRDTTVASGAFSIFVPATPQADSTFRVRFSRVRAGEGSYRRAGQAINGIVYEWVGPAGGDYVPFRVLPRPASRTVLDLRVDAEPLAGLSAWAEVARSVDDANTLSGLDAADDRAGALEAGLRLAPLATPWGEVSAGAVVRDRARDFRTLDRVRVVDYNRRWNLARAGVPFEAALDSLGERVAEAEALVRARGLGALGAEAGAVQIGGYRAERVGLRASVDPALLGTASGAVPPVAYELDGVRSRAGATDLLGSGSFFRQRLALAPALAGGRWTPSLALEQEAREQEGGATFQDAPLAPTYAFVAARPGLAYDGARLDARGAVEARWESEPLGPVGAPGELADAARALGAEAEVRARGAAASGEVTAAYRRTRYREAFRLQGREGRESLALGGTGRAALAGRAVTVRARYGALTERTPIAQEAYVLVGPEAGLFVWRDGEGEPRAGEPDGVQQVDEFFPETTPFEGLYVRTFVPSDELVPTVGADARFALQASGARLAERYGWAWADALDARGSLEVRERTAGGELGRVLLFDPRVLQDRSENGTLDGRFRAEGEVSVFPRDARRGLRLGADHLTTTRRLAVGTEARRTQALRVEGRLGLAPPFLARLALRLERRAAESTAFGTRTFDLVALTAEPSLTWTPSPEAAVTLGAVASARKDRRASGTQPTGALLLRVPADARWALRRGAQLAARAELSVVDLRGGAGAGLALFELTDGRGPGTSALAGLQATLGLTASIRATLTYDARFPSSARPVQTVRASLSAVF